jgi:ribosome maturation factor RimP
MSGLKAHFLFAENFNNWRRRQGCRKLNITSGLAPLFRFEAGVRAMAVRLEEIRAAAERVATSHGLDVVDVEFAGSTKDRTLRVFLEKNAEERANLKAAAAAKDQGAPAAANVPHHPAGGELNVEQLSGVTHEDCAAFSRDFSVLLDVEDLVPGAAYTLEASSPGLNRKLTRAEDFERFTGCLAKVQTFEPVHNNRFWRGRLIAADANGITLDLTAVKLSKAARKQRASGNTVQIALENIEKAELAPEI